MAVSTPPAVEFHRVVADGKSYCAIHGEQVGLSCAECDAKDPDAVKLRIIPGSAPTSGTVEFDLAVEKAVAKALANKDNKPAPAPAPAPAPVNPTPAVAPVA